MKVAYNNCYGGFGLSPLATTEYAAKKGITLTWYEQIKYNHEGGAEYKRVEPELAKSQFSTHASKKDLGENISEIGNDYYYESFGDEKRSDPDLIEIIERLGELANGQCASLEIEEIPDGSSFEIDEYDGNESVVLPRQSW